MTNEAIAQVLQDIASALELKGESPFRVRAYHDAARNIAVLGEPVEDLWKEGRLGEIPGVGPSIAAKIVDLLETGQCPYLDALIGEIPTGVFELLKLPGLGPKKAKILFDTLKITSLAELAEAARAHRIRGVKGMGARTEENILKELGRLVQRSERQLLGVAWPLAERIAAMLRQARAVRQVEPAGSVRRRRETIGDIDLVVAATSSQEVERALRELPITQEVLSHGPTKISFLTRESFQVDIRVVEPATWGAALLYFTGSKAHNIALRERAIKRGYKLNEYGLFRLDDGSRVAGRTEQEIYEALDLDWVPPELRENTGEIEAAEAGTLPRLITLEDIRGDFHSHSTYSDGRDSLEEMARAAIARGYEYLAITDHSYGLAIAQGLTREKAEIQWAEIRRLNRELTPFRILAGVELEIRSTGELDFPDEVLGRFDVVGASIHSGFKQPSAQITGRMLNAIGNPHVRTLNHPSGRRLNKREPYAFDLEAVLAEIKARGKAIEINGSIERMDLSDLAARRAKELGLSFTLSSDAHSVEGLEAMRLAVAIARRAWIEPQDILNTRSVDELSRRFGAIAKVRLR